MGQRQDTVESIVDAPKAPTPVENAVDSAKVSQVSPPPLSERCKDLTNCFGAVLVDPGGSDVQAAHDGQEHGIALQGLFERLAAEEA